LYSNADMKDRYKSWLSGEDEIRRNYVYTLAIATKFKRHKKNIKDIIDADENNPVRRFRKLLSELNDGSKSIEDFVEKEGNSSLALEDFARKELKLSEN